MEKFEFCIPEGISIPTDLKVKKGKIIVNYHRDCDDSMTWHFTVYNAGSSSEADNIIHEIIQLMCDQSFDHGAEWRMTSCEMGDSCFNNFLDYADFKVSFRIKDSW